MTIRTKLMTEDDLEMADAFIEKTFYQDEPVILANGIRFTPKGLNQLFLPHGLSIAAYDDETGTIVGMAINDTECKERRCYTLSTEDKKFQHMFEYIERMSDIENVAPKAIEIRYLAVDQSWRGRGVARAMVEASIDVARAAGYRWMKMYTTSHFSELLIIRMKWTRLYSISYKDYVTEFNSEIKTPPEPHTRCSLYVYDLKSESN